jgi:hypothetical protein
VGVAVTRFTGNAPIQVPYGKTPTVPFKDARKDTPDRMGNAWSVLGIAFCSGLVALFAGMFLIWALYSIGKPIKIGAAGFLAGGTMLIVLALGLRRLYKDPRLITTIETITGHDLNHDGWVGPQQSTELNLHDGRGHTQRWKVPFPPEIILEWGEAILEGESTAYAAWSDRFARRPDLKDGPDNYREFRKCLVRGRLARENGTHSIDLTRRGFDLFTALVEEGIDDLPPTAGRSPKSVTRLTKTHRNTDLV